MRRAEIHADAGRRIEHPSRNDHHHAWLDFDEGDLFAAAAFYALEPNASAE